MSELIIPSPEFFRNYFEYVVWGDRRQLELVRELPPEEYFKDRGFSFGSIHRVLLHELAAQSIWLDRFEGARPVWLMDDAAIDSLSTLETRWSAIHERGRNFMESLTEDRLASTLNYDNARGDKFSMPLWQALFHMCQHAYYHRSQLNSMIKLAGRQGVSVDYSTWVNTKGSGNARA